jgi:5-methylcytosine-specific restriction protein A
VCGGGKTTAIHPLEGRKSDFRNPAGVERKTGDLVSRIPGSGRRVTNGNRLDGEVVAAFLSRPEEMRAEAQAIESALRAWGNNPYALPDTDSMTPVPTKAACC